MKRKVISFIIILCLLSFNTIVYAGEWNSFNLNYNSISPTGSFSTSKSGWVLKLSRMGYYYDSEGRLPYMVAKEPDISILEGKQYNVSFNMKATRDKWIFFKISNNDDSECNICKWIDLRKDKTKKISISFKSKYNFSNIYFSCVGVYSLKPDTIEYKYKPPYQLDSRLGDDFWKLPVTITCNNFSVKEIKGARLSKRSLAVKKGKCKTITLKNATSKVKWKNTNKKVISFKKKGKNKIKLKALRAGKATITAIYKGKKYKCKVTVK